MKDRNILQYKSFNNEYRRRIFELCKKPRNFTELKNLLNISTGSLVHHLNILETEELIKKENIMEKNKFSVGKKVRITSVIEKLGEVMEAEKKFAEKQSENFFPESRQKEILNLLKQNQPIERRDFKKLLTQKGFSIWEEGMLLTTMVFSGYIDEHLRVSDQGKKFLEENTK